MLRQYAFHSLLACTLLTLAACDSMTPGPDAETAGFTSASVANGASRVPVCHLTGSDTNEYLLVEVAEPAYDTHVAHGDASPMDEVPGMEGFVFDADCVPLGKVEVLSLSCPADGVAAGDPMTIKAVVNPDAAGPITHAFDFGDGSPIAYNSPTQTHVYATDGEYTATYTATGPLNEASESCTFHIVVP